MAEGLRGGWRAWFINLANLTFPDDSSDTDGDTSSLAADDAWADGPPTAPAALQPFTVDRAALEAWSAAAGEAQGERRAEALARVDAWCAGRMAPMPLDLSGLGLTSLPPLPGGVTELRAGNNRLRQLPPLPAGLKHLQVTHNRLAELPERLPDSPEYVDAGGNVLTHLPEPMPRHLKKLFLSENRLGVLPAALPEGLQVLNIDHNPLGPDGLLTDPLPSTLNTLACADTRLARLPAALPDGLVFIDIQVNRIERLPDVMPARLQRLRAAGNRLDRLPLDFPPTMVELNIADNPAITGLAEVLRRLGPGCRAALATSQFAPADFEAVQAARRDGTWTGARLDFEDLIESDLEDEDEDLGPDDHASDDEVDEALGADTAPPLSRAASRWLDDDPAAAAFVARAGAEPGADAYSLYLTKLYGSTCALDPAFRAKIARDLRLVAERPSLRRKCFLQAFSASETCSDGALTVFMMMQERKLQDRIEQGEFDDAPERLAAPLRQGARRAMLADIGDERIKELAGRGLEPDRVEVALAYQVKLRDELDLGPVAPAMDHERVAHWREGDGPAAVERVRAREREDLLAYLATRSDPFDAFMRRFAPEAYDELEQKLVDAMEKPFRDRLAARLAETGLGGDDDAERQLGAQVREELFRETRMPLARRLLHEHGLISPTAGDAA